VQSARTVICYAGTFQPSHSVREPAIDSLKLQAPGGRSDGTYRLHSISCCPEALTRRCLPVTNLKGLVTRSSSSDMLYIEYQLKGVGGSCVAKVVPEVMSSNESLRDSPTNALVSPPVHAKFGALTN